MDGAYIALRGYKFQFDRTILEMFNNSTKTIEIEQLQDYGYDDYNIQVKYHNTDYTASEQKQKIKKPLLQIIEQFKADKTKKFILYIYLKGVTPLKKTLSVSELDDILGRLNKLSTTEKTEFVNSFTLIFADDFETQYNNVIQCIKTSYSKTIEEAEIYYSIISSHLLDIVKDNPPSNKALRVIRKSDIDKLIMNGKKVIFKSTYIEFLAKEKQLKHLKNLFFKSNLNKEPFERIFIIEVSEPIQNQKLKELVLTIKTKWSKNKTKTIPASDRFVPYIFLNGIDDDTLVKLKTELQKDGYPIIDGYDFFNAPFRVESIKVKPTFENRIFFKFINKLEDLEDLTCNLDKTNEIYQFFTTTPLSINSEDKHIKIEIQEIEDIKHII